MRYPLFLSVVLLALDFDASILGQEYPIKITRPTKAGVKYRLDGTGSVHEQQTIVTGGKTNRTARAHSMVFVGVAQVLETDAKGNAIKALLTVEKCVKTTGQSRLDLLPAGTAITATSTNGQTDFSLKDGSTLLPRDAELLRLVIPLYNGGIDDDELFGTAEQRRPGSSWPINSDAAARDMQKRKMEVKPEDIRGTTRFTVVTNMAGQDCLELRTEMHITGVTPPLPPGTRLTRSEVKASIAGLFPVDATRGRVSDSARWTIQSAFEGPTGPKKQLTTVDSIEERQTERRFTYLAD